MTPCLVGAEITSLPPGLRPSRSVPEDASCKDVSSLYSPHKSIKAILLDDIPKPKFSTRSPSSPAKLTHTPKTTSPVKAQRLVLCGLPPAGRPQDTEEKQQPGKTTPKLASQPWTLGNEPGITPVQVRDFKVTETYDKETFNKDFDVPEIKEVPDPVKLDNGNEESESGSDTEIAPYLLDKDAVQQKLLALKLEDRGNADGESPREDLSQENAARHNGTSSVVPVPLECTFEKSDLKAAFEQIKLTDVNVGSSILSSQNQTVLEHQHVFRTKVERDLVFHQNNIPDFKKSMMENRLPDGKSESSHKPVVERAVVHSKVLDFESIANSAHQAVSNISPYRLSHHSLSPKIVRDRDFDSELDSSSQSASGSSNGRGRGRGGGGGEGRGRAGREQQERGRSRRRQNGTHNLCTGTMSEADATELTLVRASMDTGMLDSTTDILPPKPPPGQAPSKAVASAAVRLECNLQFCITYYSNRLFFSPVVFAECKN